MAARNQHVPSLPGTCGTPRVGGLETRVHCHRDAPELNGLWVGSRSRYATDIEGRLSTFLYNFSNEDFGEPCHDLGDRHGDLLTEALLNYLPRRRVRTWALRGWIGSRVIPFEQPASGGHDGDMPRNARIAPA
jgi:hypothetical protein